MEQPQKVPYGFCHCGCGKRTNISDENNAYFGYVKGEPFKYLPSHGLKNRRKGGFPPGTKVDAEFQHLASEYTWYLKSGQYVYADKWDGGKRERLILHRIVANAPKGSVVDHINHNTLDNRRENLRIADKRLNGQNRRGASSRSTTGYRNVCARKDGRFTAQVNLNGVTHYLGCFATAIEAAEAATKFRRKYMPASTK